MNVGPLSRLLKSDVQASPDNWRSLLKLGMEAQKEARFEEAEQFYAAAYEKARERLGPKDIVISEILMQVADLKDVTGHGEGAKIIRSRARAIISDVAASLEETAQA